MGRQNREDPWSGTIDIVTFYKMRGKGYFRAKSSLDKKRVKKDKAFGKTRQNASWFGKAVTIARKIYDENFTRGDANRFAVWYPMRNRAQQLVREGVLLSEIQMILQKEFLENREARYRLKSTDYCHVTPLEGPLPFTSPYQRLCK